MARSRINQPTQDLIQDSGAVLWSFVKGEQLEFPIFLNFVEDVTQPYQYEAVVVEAETIPGLDQLPTDIKDNGVQDTLVVRVPVNRGFWQAEVAYNKEDIVQYDGQWWKLILGAARVSAIPPDEDPLWEETSIQRIYVQFPATLGDAYEVQPVVGRPTYGFFELRVTEPADPIFSRTWKPVRGLVQILFSPTDIVPDV